MIVIVAIVAPGLALPLAIPLIAAALVALAMAGVPWWKYRDRATDRRAAPQFRNPLDLRTALEFGVIFAIIMFISQAAQQMVGASALYLVSAVSGLVDVDAITLSIATLWSKGDVAPTVAVRVIAMAAAVNTIVKSVLAAFIGGPRLGLRVSGPLLAALIAGAAMVVWPRL